MFHVVGTAATQYSRTAPDATGAATAAATPHAQMTTSVASRLTGR